jgi:outer membrane protein assembly factor BamB
MSLQHTPRWTGPLVAAALVLGTAAGLGPLGVAAASTGGGSPWLQGGNGHHRSGMNAAETELRAGNLDEIERVGSVPRMGAGTPVVVGGAVYVSRNFRGPTRFAKYSLADLTTVWARDVLEETPTPVADGAFDGGHFVTLTRTHVSANNVDGARIWQRSLPENAAPSSPTVKDGLGYVVDASGTLTALDIKTGATVWSVSFTAPGGGPGAIGPAVIHGKNLLVARPNMSVGGTAVTSLDPKSGGHRWTTAIGDVAGPRLIVRRGLVVAVAERELQVLRARDGVPVWRLSEEELGCRATSFGLPAVARGSIFLPHNCEIDAASVGGLAKIDLESGHEWWRVTYSHPIDGIATAASDFVVVNTQSAGSEDIVVHGMGGGRVVRTLDIGDSPIGPVAIAEGRLFATNDGDLVVFGLPT